MSTKARGTKKSTKRSTKARGTKKSTKRSTKARGTKKSTKRSTKASNKSNNKTRTPKNTTKGRTKAKDSRAKKGARGSGVLKGGTQLGIEKGDKTLGRIKIGGEAGLESDYSAGDFKEGAEDVFDSIKSVLRLQREKSLTIYDSSAIEPRQIEQSPKFALNSLTYTYLIEYPI